MRISDWSSDVCSSDLFEEQSSVLLQAATKVGEEMNAKVNGIGQTVSTQAQVLLQAADVIVREVETARGIFQNKASEIARITSAIQFQNDRVEELSRRHGELMEQAVERAAAVAQQIAGALEQKIVTLEQAVSRASGEAGRIGTSFVESAQAITTAAEVTVARATAASESFGRATQPFPAPRPATRRVGKEGVSTVRDRGGGD